MTTKTIITKMAAAEEMLKQGQKRARVRTYDSVEEVQTQLADAVEAIWAVQYLTIEQMVGMKIMLDAAQGERFASSYNGIPESTHVTLDFTRKGWVVSNVERDWVNSRATTPWCYLQLTQAQLDQAVENFRRTPGVSILVADRDEQRVS